MYSKLAWLFFLFFPCCFAFITWIEPRVPLKGKLAEPGTPWPLPQDWRSSDTQFDVHPNDFHITSNAAACDVIDEAIKRYQQLCFLASPSPTSTPSSTSSRLLRTLVLHIEQPDRCLYPQADEDESYHLEITTLKYSNVTANNTSDVQDLRPVRPVARIRCVSVWGALRALETFSQLVHPIGLESEIYFKVNATLIHDYPAYSYRGFMLDTARHFIPQRTILALLDAMADNKMNVLHWHLIDDQSWPLQSARFPRLHTKGAFSPRHVYSQQVVFEIIEHARLRGIRVIPELDSPGHTNSLRLSYPHLLTVCYARTTPTIAGLRALLRTANKETRNNALADVPETSNEYKLVKEDDETNAFGYKPMTANYPTHSEQEILDPSRNETYDFMGELLVELRRLFVDEYIHLGMDEVNYACWQSNPTIRRYMRTLGLRSMNELYQHYVKKLLALANDAMFKYIVWQDPVEDGVQLGEKAIVQIWKDKSLDGDSSHYSWQEYAKMIAKNGHRMIISSCWYLNYIKYPYPGKDWEPMYECDPMSFTEDERERKLIIGGEACLWGEFVDATNLLSRAWPRACATAERLWTNPSIVDIDSTRFRLDQQRCRMLQRGIPAAPILNGFCGNYEWDMNN